jgi:hypothetical protein
MNLSQRRAKVPAILAGLMLTGVALQPIGLRRDGRPIDNVHPAYFSAIVFGGVHNFTFCGRIELRARRAIIRGDLIRWDRVIGYGWVRRRHDSVFVLRVGLRLHFLPPVRLPVDDGQRQQVEAVMGQCVPE